MNITRTPVGTRRALRPAFGAALLALAIVGCGDSATRSASVAPIGSPTPSVSAAASDTPQALPPSASSSAAAAASQEPDVGGGTTSGDVPDNAVFLTYHQANHGFSIQYVEGWQVRTLPDGVAISDKDSSETVTVVDLPSDVAAYIASTDLPALKGQAGFRLHKQDKVKVGGATYDHLVYHALSPADPVTGKQVPSTIDRYYVPGPAKLAIISLSTPDGVDNVDAFRQMIESFAWT